MKNWTIKDAVNTINAGTDVAGIKELAKHFPLFTLAVAKGDLVAVANMMTDKMTVRRLEHEQAAETSETETEAEVQEETTSEVNMEDLEKMSAKQLMKVCDQKGIKVPHYGKNKQFYIDTLIAAMSEEDATEAGGDDDWGDEEQSNPYDGKTAMELYKLCKSRKIKAAPKKPAKCYIDLLMKADAEAEEDAGSEDDDWGEDEEEAPKAKATKSKATKAAKQTKKAAPKKKAPEPEPEEDDDDDDEWDI